ncbi:MAG: sugar ABC transporter permease [Oscillospiraceae bacterium]|nr:sugar ABC transporter permease [Oscillospiraceae bacterium]
MKSSNGASAFFRRDSVQAVMMLSPMLIGFLVFTYIPIIYIMRFSVYNYNGFTEATFNGIDNFVRVLMRDARYWESMWNTLALTLAKLAVEIPLALLLAIQLNKALRGTGFFRVALFLPTIISVAIVGLVFSLMFASYQGFINSVLMDIGLIARPIDWFSSKWTAMFVIGVASIWTYLGINMIFFLMALQSIPAELYECAMLDGASGPRRFFSITLPMIGPIFRVVLLMAIIGSLKVNELVLASTNGQPGGRTEVVMSYIFKVFFGQGGERRPEVGYASAMSVVTGIFLGIVTFVYLKASKKMNAN